jgi:hypothetical protein
VPLRRREKKRHRGRSIVYGSRASCECFNRVVDGDDGDVACNGRFNATATEICGVYSEFTEGLALSFIIVSEMWVY